MAHIKSLEEGTMRNFILENLLKQLTDKRDSERKAYYDSLA